jgi:DNA-binding NarL/FixJ family response regulator
MRLCRGGLRAERLRTYARTPQAAQTEDMHINTILVEDNKAISDVLIPTMVELGNMHVLAVAQGAQDGIRVLHDFEASWQLAVVDLFLKQGSGLEIVQSCGLDHPGRVVIVLSNYATPQMREKCLALGADGVFDKSTQLDASSTSAHRNFR